MSTSQWRFARRLMVTTCPLALSLAVSGPVLAQTTSASSATAAKTKHHRVHKHSTATQAARSVPAVAAAPGSVPTSAPVAPSAPSAAASGQTENIEVRRQRMLLAHRNIATTVSELSKEDVKAVGPSGSIQSVLKQIPSVNSYQSGFGQNLSSLSVRGVKQQELATNVDGVPFNDIIHGGTGNYLSNNVGQPVNLFQIQSVDVYPGIAPPDTNGLNTLGGTIAYQTKKPTDKFYLDVNGGIGNFGYDHFGFELNTGTLKQAGDLKMLLRYDQSETSGFIENTNSKYRDMLFNAIKPYNDGLSNVFATVIYNNDFGYVQGATVPDYYTSRNLFYNYPKSVAYTREDNQFLTVILGDQTYLTDWLDVGIKAFYVRQESDFQGYTNPSVNDLPYPFIANYQNPYSVYGPIGPSAYAAGLTTRSKQGVFTYDPLTTFGSYAQGEAYEYNPSHTDEIGLAPRATFVLPHNNIVVGALIAKEWDTGSTSYVWGNSNVPEINGFNSVAWDNPNVRTTYRAYAQDRIDLLDNKLHIQPGITLEGIDTDAYRNTSYSQPHSYVLSNFYRNALPFLGVDYQLPYHLDVYADTGRSSLYPDVSNYTISRSINGFAGGTAAPGPATVHSYQVGLRYNTPTLYANLDYYYQKETSAIGFYDNYAADISEAGNFGALEFKGVEASVKYKVTPEITLFANGSYNLAKYMESYSASTTIFNDQFGYAFKGNHVPGAPEWSATFGVNYAKKNVLTHNDNVNIRFWGDYTGEQFTTYNISPDYPVLELQDATVPNENYKLAAFTVFNLDANYTLPLKNMYAKSINFDLNLQNIFNLHYKSYEYQSYAQLAGGFGPNSYLSGFPGMPFGVVLETSLRF